MTSLRALLTCSHPPPRRRPPPRTPRQPQQRCPAHTPSLTCLTRTTRSSRTSPSRSWNCTTRSTIRRTSTPSTRPSRHTRRRRRRKSASRCSPRSSSTEEVSRRRLSYCSGSGTRTRGTAAVVTFQLVAFLANACQLRKARAFHGRGGTDGERPGGSSKIRLMGHSRAEATLLRGKAKELSTTFT